MSPQLAGVLVAAGLLAGCANSSGGRAQLITPEALHEVGAAYSEVELKLRLLVVPEQADCADGSCQRLSSLEQRVDDIGQRLVRAAYALHADLEQRIPRFDFRIENKLEPGVASSAGGLVVIYRGVEKLGLTDDELAFVLAREIAHVAERHHEENVASSLLVSLLAQIFLPVLQVANGAAALISGNTLHNTAIASAASLAGSSALKASYRPVQLQEADESALRLLAAAGWDCHRVTESLEIFSLRQRDGGGDWERELRISTARLASLFQGPPHLPSVHLARGEGEWRLGYLARPSLLQPREISSPF